MASVAKREWTHNGIVKSAWVVRYTDQRGKRRMKTFEQKKVADRYRLQVETEIERGDHTAEADTMTVVSVCDLYLKHSESRMRDGRIGRNRYNSVSGMLRKPVVPNIGKVLLTELTAPKIDELYRTIVSAGGVSPMTAKTIIYYMRGVEEFAIRRELMKKRPVSDGLKELRGIKAEPIKTFNKEQIYTILQTAAGYRKKRWERVSLMLFCFVNISAFCGLRCGEIHALTRQNIDLDRRVLKVRHNLTKWDELKGPKTRAGVRDVPMAAHVVELIKAWLDRYFVPNERDLVFRTKDGHRWGSSDLWKSWNDLLADAGLASKDRFHFHALRHFAASWMIENGLPVTEVAVLLGHDKFDTTLQIYAHPVVGSAHRHAAIERMAVNLLEAPTADASQPAFCAPATRVRHELITL